MHKVNNQEIPRIFDNLILKKVHEQTAIFLKSNFCLKNVSLSSPKHSISFRAPKSWNSILHKEVKE